MRRLILFVCALALLSAPRTSAQQLLPDHFGTWTAERPSVVIWPRNSSWPLDLRKGDLDLQERDDEQVLAESGVVGVEERLYKKGGLEFEVRLYQLRDPSSAYELYTFYLDPAMTPAHVGQSSASNEDGVEILVGKFAIRSSSPKGVSPDDLRSLVAALQPKADQAPLPPIPGYLPVNGRIPGTERYALGPAGFRAALGSLDRAALSPLASAVGFDAGAEAIFARYRKGSGDAVVLLLEYPTPQLAGRFQKHIEQALTSLQQPNESAIRRKGSVLSLVLRPSSHDYAEALLEDVRYETQVTWNESSTTLTDPPWPVMIVNTIVGTGVFMVAAIVFGLAFGGVRVFTKILLPGKVFDRPQQMEILQLGIGSKPIDSRDFYSGVGR